MAPDFFCNFFFKFLNFLTALLMLFDKYIYHRYMFILLEIYFQYLYNGNNVLSEKYIALVAFNTV